MEENLDHTNPIQNIYYKPVQIYAYISNYQKEKVSFTYDIYYENYLTSTMMQQIFHDIYHEDHMIEHAAGFSSLNAVV